MTDVLRLLEMSWNVVMNVLKEVGVVVRLVVGLMNVLIGCLQD